MKTNSMPFAWLNLKRTTRLLPLIGLLTILSGCSGGYEVCAAPIVENCRTFRSRAHYQRWVKAESSRQKVMAERFPDDYRDVVAVTLKEYLQNNDSEWPSTREQYFVSVFGEDADATTLAKLQRLGIEALPGSEYAPSSKTPQFQNSQGEYLNNSEVYVSQIERLASGAYRVEFGYYCGKLCAGHLAFRLRKERGAWVFTSKKALLFS